MSGWRQHPAATPLQELQNNIKIPPSMLYGYLRGNVRLNIICLYLTWRRHGGKFGKCHGALAGALVARRDSAGDASLSPWLYC